MILTIFIGTLAIINLIVYTLNHKIYNLVAALLLAFAWALSVSNKPKYTTKVDIECYNGSCDTSITYTNQSGDTTILVIRPLNYPKK